VDSRGVREGLDGLMKDPEKFEVYVASRLDGAVKNRSSH
jgi:hypothetical protein